VSPWPEYSKQQRVDLYARHVRLFAETWQDGQRNIATLNKFCKIYINGFDGAKELREHLMAASSADELLAILAGA
jgi:tRNA-dihydrouridine synthase